MGTIHANSARQALTKLHTYTKMAEEALSDDVVADMIAQTIDLVCQLRLLPMAAGSSPKSSKSPALRPGEYWPMNWSGPPPTPSRSSPGSTARRRAAAGRRLEPGRWRPDAAGGQRLDGRRR